MPLAKPMYAFMDNPVPASLAKCMFSLLTSPPPPNPAVVAVGTDIDVDLVSGVCLPSSGSSGVRGHDSGGHVLSGQSFSSSRSRYRHLGPPSTPLAVLSPTTMPAPPVHPSSRPTLYIQKPRSTTAHPFRCPRGLVGSPLLLLVWQRHPPPPSPLDH